MRGRRPIPASPQLSVPQVVGCKCLAHSRSLHLPLDFSLKAAFILLTAVASALFHATLLLRWQRVDETFENMILIFMLRGSDSSVRPALLHAAAATAGIVFASCILFCEVHLVGMAISNILKLRRVCLTTFHASSHIILRNIGEHSPALSVNRQDSYTLSP